jgi:hypothetical protein
MFKKSVIVLLLLITPFAQARAVLICSMMKGEVVQHCVCPGHVDQRKSTRHDAPDGTCCDVVIQVSDKDFAGVGAAVKRIGHDAPDIAAVVAPAAVIPTVFAVSNRLRFDGTLNRPPSRLYLRTARLRL